SKSRPRLALEGGRGMMGLGELGQAPVVGLGLGLVQGAVLPKERALAVGLGQFTQQPQSFLLSPHFRFPNALMGRQLSSISALMSGERFLKWSLSLLGIRGTTGSFASVSWSIVSGQLTKWTVPLYLRYM